MNDYVIIIESSNSFVKHFTVLTIEGAGELMY